MASTRSILTRGELRLERSIAGFFARIAVDPIRYAVGAVASGLLVGGTIFSFVEAETSWFDGIWWAFVSMTTVGYGDIAPKTTEIRMLATFVIATGIIATAILTAALAGRIAEARLADSGMTLDLDDDFDDLAARIGALKERYQHDERYDDMLLRRAEHVVASFREQGGDGADPHMQRAVRELEACLTAHPEWQEQHRGA